MLSGGAGNALAQSEVLNVGFFELPPHASSKDGRFSGTAIAYFGMVAREMGVKPRYTMLPLARLQADPNIDMILYLGKSPERAKRFVFPKLPMLKMRGTITVRKDSPLIAVEKSEDLLGLNIGVYSEGYRSAIMRDPRLTLYEMPSDTLVPRSLQMVILKRIDGFYIPDAYSLRQGVKALELENQVRVLHLPSGNDALYSAFSKSASLKYLARYEQAYADVSKRITYEAFLERQLARKAP